MDVEVREGWKRRHGEMAHPGLLVCSIFKCMSVCGSELLCSVYNYFGMSVDVPDVYCKFMCVRQF